MSKPTFNILVRTDDAELQSLGPYDRLYAAVQDSPTGKINVLRGAWRESCSNIMGLNNQDCIAGAFEDIAKCFAALEGRRTLGTPVADLREWGFRLPYQKMSNTVPLFGPAIKVVARTRPTEFVDLSCFVRIHAAEHSVAGGKVTILFGGQQEDEAIAYCQSMSNAVKCIDAIIEAVSRGNMVADLQQWTFMPPADVLAKIGAAS